MGCIDRQAQSQGQIKLRLTAALLIAAFGWPLSQAAADDYPSKPITLIVPFPAGGGVDAIGRIVGDKLSAALGQPVIIDNRGGAAGVIGTRVAARAAPDGYTLVMATSGTIAINPNLYVNPGYHTLQDLAPIGLISTTPIVLMAHPSAPEQSLAALIASAKQIRASSTSARRRPAPAPISVRSFSSRWRISTSPSSLTAAPGP